ncbi:MAG: hypothetical protein M3137_19185 [Actinomycetota bacterium]|nr:hypothetical protein [Actinomycetota bacterium]
MTPTVPSSWAMGYPGSLHRSRPRRPRSPGPQGTPLVVAVVDVELVDEEEDGTDVVVVDVG